MLYSFTITLCKCKVPTHGKAHSESAQTSSPLCRDRLSSLVVRRWVKGYLMIQYTPPLSTLREGGWRCGKGFLWDHSSCFTMRWEVCLSSVLKTKLRLSWFQLFTASMEADLNSSTALQPGLLYSPECDTSPGLSSGLWQSHKKL